jgi:hypothetical protein
MVQRTAEWLNRRQIATGVVVGVVAYLSINCFVNLYLSLRLDPYGLRLVGLERRLGLDLWWLDPGLVTLLPWALITVIKRRLTRFSSGFASTTVLLSLLSLILRHFDPGMSDR